MKIITLNTWGGRVSEPLMDFFKKHQDVDIFCLQEIYHNAKDVLVEYKEDRLNLFSDIQQVLPDYESYFRPSISNYGLALFAKKGLEILDEGEVLIYKKADYQGGADHPRNLQYIHINYLGKEYTISNVHGLWNGKGKGDSEERLEQSRAIKSFVDSSRGHKIICGDFNLSPDTESVSILDEGMRNLIKEYNVASTRTSLYPKSIRHADYIFVSPDINVKEFKVLPDEVSDHSPLFLEF